MIINKKKIHELEARIEALEKAFLTQNVPCEDNVSEASYKEVIDEWLNGKKSTSAR